MSTEYTPGEPDSWTWPDAYGDNDVVPDCLDCGHCKNCIDRSIASAEEQAPEATDTHWSEVSGQWYYVGTVSDQWDYITHDVDAEDLTAEMSGMYLLWKDGRSEPAPTTRAAWELRSIMEEPFGEDHEPVCVGKVVDGMCVPIGSEDLG